MSVGFSFQSLASALCWPAVGFHHRTVTLTKINRIMGCCCDRPWHVSLGGLWEDLGAWGRKGIECAKLTELFCGSLEDNVESSRDDGDLPCEVPEGCLRVT